MAEKQRFDLSIDRVDKIPVPLLVVGLGGTGCDALLTIKQTFAERYFTQRCEGTGTSRAGEDCLFGYR